MVEMKTDKESGNDRNVILTKSIESDPSISRLFVQIERILRINELNVISDDVVEAARSTLVIGAT